MSKSSQGLSAVGLTESIISITVKTVRVEPHVARVRGERVAADT